MHEIRVPKLNNNDDSYVLLEWYAEDGQAVQPGDPVVAIETSKAVEELATPAGGLLRRFRAASEQCAPGDLIARVGPSTEPVDPLSPDPAASAHTEPNTAETGAPTLTESALRFAEQHEISSEAIASLGRRVVRVKDLEGLLVPLRSGPARGRQDSAVRTGNGRSGATGDGRAGAGRKRQAGVARNVAAAAQIPAAYSLAHLDANSYRALTLELTTAGRVAPAPLELLLKIIAGLYEQHPALFVESSPNPAADRIGVTVDTGNGLFIPTVDEAGSRPLTEIAQQLRANIQTARSGYFAADQLHGARISVSVTAYAGVVLTVPLIHPDQVAMLSLGMLTSRVVMADGAPRESWLLPLGISYDHRAVNGRDAITFLRAIGSRFGDRHWLDRASAE